MYTVADVVADEQLQHREVFISVDDAELGAVTVQAAVPRLLETPATINHLGPRLGEHNVDVYPELLGLNASDVEDLRARGVL